MFAIAKDTDLSTPSEGRATFCEAPPPLSDPSDTIVK